ncbi:YmaF family protein [Metabacillus sp. RGM 3146]|uniref:YmaF family protein n=1 Tax=Metabacillus sp. RGM 3146 TaxID=3401092 RepID=UPI003B9CA3DE
MRSIFAPSYKPSHSHLYAFETLNAEDHFHIINRFTKPVNGDSYDAHIHYYSGITSFNNGHYHRFYGETGPAIPREDGSHYHEIYGVTYNNYTDPPEGGYGGVVYGTPSMPVHKHAFGGNTSNPVGVDE